MQNVPAVASDVLGIVIVGLVVVWNTMQAKKLNEQGVKTTSL